MQTIIVNKENKYPLYTAELAGQSWDKDTRYEMVIVTKWTDRTEIQKKFHTRHIILHLILHILKIISAKRNGVKIYTRITKNTRDLRLKGR